MDRRIRFYSDDSYAPCGKKRVHAVIAGAAVEADRTNVHEALIDAERVSKKQLTDWCHTPEPIRERYLEQVFSIGPLRGRLFFRAFDVLTSGEKWEARVATLEAAIGAFTPGRCHHALFPEGLMGGPRYQLRAELRKRGCEQVTVDAGQFYADPEVRLADAIAGYVRAELYRGDGQRAALTNIPDWFVELGALKNETPRSDPGGEKPRP